MAYVMGVAVVSATAIPSRIAPYHLTGIQEGSSTGTSSEIHLVFENGYHMHLGGEDDLLLHPDPMEMVGKRFWCVISRYELRVEDVFLECFARLDQAALHERLWKPHAIRFTDGTEFPVVLCVQGPEKSASFLNGYHYQGLDEPTPF